MAAEEANDPERDMPRGIITAMTILLVTGCTDAVHCARRCRVLGDCGLGQPSCGGHPIRLWRGHLGSRLRQLRGLSGPSRQLFLDRVRGALLINIAVFGATVSYVLMMVSHIVLRIREPELERPYRTPGGVVTTAVALTLALTAVIATFFVDEKAAGITALIFVVALAYFWFYSRHRLVASAPEEEFAAIQQAESELS